MLTRNFGALDDSEFDYAKDYAATPRNQTPHHLTSWKPNAHQNETELTCFSLNRWRSVSLVVTVDAVMSAQRVNWSVRFTKSTLPHLFTSY